MGPSRATPAAKLDILMVTLGTFAAPAIEVPTAEQMYVEFAFSTAMVELAWSVPFTRSHRVMLVEEAGRENKEPAVAGPVVVDTTVTLNGDSSGAPTEARAATKPERIAVYTSGVKSAIGRPAAIAPN